MQPGPGRAICRSPPCTAFPPGSTYSSRCWSLCWPGDRPGARSIRCSFLHARLTLLRPLELSACGNALVAQHLDLFHLRPVIPALREFQDLDDPWPLHPVFLFGLGLFAPWPPQYRRFADGFERRRMTVLV